MKINILHILLALVILTIPVVHAHVGYVLPEELMIGNSGSDLSYFLSPLSEPVNLALIVITALVFFSAYFIITRSKIFRKWYTHVEKEAGRYDIFIPWIARLGLGIALIGAGSAQVFISPVQHLEGILATLEILLGFMLLAGFFTGIVVWIALVIYVAAVIVNPYIFGNLDFAMLCIALLAIGSTKPGVDDLFGIGFFHPMKELKRYIPLLLRVGIGFSMIFLALYEKILNPHLARLVVEQYGLNIAIPVSISMWVFATGVIELLVGLALLLGVKTRLTVAIAFVVLTMSFFYFNEAVFSHITLFATLSILFVTGAGTKSWDELQNT